jgi:PAS domain S-box-containing protein
MTEGTRLVGFVGFDAVQQPRSWEEETIMLLRVLGDTFANSLARMETEQALREREAQYRSVVENVRDIVFQTDTDGCWTFLNPAWEEATGFSVEESLGQRFDKHIESDHFGDDGPCASMLCGEEEGRFEVELQGRKGTRWMALFAQALYDDDGRRTGVAGTLHDITDRKRMEQKTREALQRERELNKLKSSFVSMVSHEFRTPLSTIRSSSEMIARFIEQGRDEKRDKYLRRIRRQVDRMTRLLGDVITTSKLDAQNNGPDLYATDLRRFMREIGEEMQSHFGRDRTLDIDLVDVPDRVPLDRDLLHHIAGNLISNALKYSPEEEPVEVSFRLDDEYLAMQVRDHGIGISASDEPHLFQAFYRGGNVGKIEGVGLGMTIVRRAVDVYDGTIGWETTPGGGTTFTVILPTTERARSMPKELPDHVHTPSDVDDDEIDRVIEGER